MPYYSEAESHDLRLHFEKIVLKWPGVHKKMMFGSPAYMTRKTSFAMLVTGGMILTRLSVPEKERLLEDRTAAYFEGHGRVMKNGSASLSLHHQTLTPLSPISGRVMKLPVTKKRSFFRCVILSLFWSRHHLHRHPHRDCTSDM
jgi:hypothetical protein